MSRIGWGCPSLIGVLFAFSLLLVAGLRPIVAETADSQTAASVEGTAASAIRSASTPTTDRPEWHIAVRIDELLAADWARDGIAPAPDATDAEFLRRASLDLTGVIPTVGEARVFLADADPHKRHKLIDRLLASSLHADHLATTWRGMMVPRGASVDGFDGQAGLQKWLRAEFVKNERYDQMVADLLVATGVAQDGPGLFFTAFDLKPEELAANTARVFLGIQIECAQCHDHPFDQWKQQDFWGYAAFFARLSRGGDNPGARSMMQLVDKREGEVTLPGSSVAVPPRYPRGEAPAEGETGTRRMQLGIWMVSRDNPFLARAAVNRAWALLFGRGLVEPVDDLSERNRPSHPEVFDALAAYFVESGFDLRSLLRVMTATRAYGLSSRSAADDAVPAASCARMPVKSLTPEQFYDSLMRAALMNGPGGAASAGNLDIERQGFVTRLQSQTSSRVEFDAGVAQVLQLLNGPEVTASTNGETSGLLGALAAPVFSDRERIEILFLALLARLPDERELDGALEYLAQHRTRNTADASTDADNAEQSSSQPLGDLMWALINSAEFALNH